MRKINQSAIRRTSDGRIWTGKRHSNIIREIVSTGQAKSVRTPEFEQGFVTDQGEFVDRREALLIATQRRQIRQNARPGGMLTSEDIY